MPGGTVTKADGFTVNRASPTITSVSPNQGNQGETLSVTITGTHFDGATAVSFGSGVTVDNFTVDNDIQITADISISSTAAAEAKTVSVTTAGGTGSLASAFTVTAKETPKSSNSHTKIWIGVGVVAAVVLVAGIVIYVVQSKRADAKAKRTAKRK
jgi:hypothetical protein